MARALELAQRGLYTTDPNPRVGCVIVKDGIVVGEGWHQRAGEAHAEVHALAAAGERARSADVYVTLEPCSHTGRTPPCVDALVRAGVRRVIVATGDPNPRVNGQGLERLRAAGISVDVGLLVAQAESLNSGFISRMRHGRPYVRLKIAASLDGRTALASGESRWITGAAARADVQHWRARSSAILTGIGTVLADDPALTVRDFDIGRQPLRVVADSSLRMSTTAQMLRLSGPTLIATTSVNDDRIAALTGAGAEVVCLPAADKVDLAGVMRLLAERQINELLVEAGPHLCGALLAQGLVDELLMYFAPHLLGDAGRGMFHLPFITSMTDRVALEIIDTRVVGNDWRIRARPTTNN
ncbi:MAG: bifunctional diaminohydroxyphosphoribosylaminopyrimidine deaminase/5-amino-6-(5-phosphoribosylamino)uracil reductase RibD [Gammaproteobacteria bacterium]|nr:bifunctional diaminohydroxyphosphoribosylaminopyrimidine deaminase/5-amino-6-(5-phosphoribosylamino)uracil reductase RibD [Gammaproteobacteria bacterium]